MKGIKIFGVIMCLLWLQIGAIAQTTIGGIVNKYAAVTNINFCANAVAVSTTVGFSVGQKVMLIQMKGAEIDNMNGSSYGNILNYRGAGNYEINEIKVVSGNFIEFKYALMRDYQTEGLQLVSLEEYNDAVVTSPLTAQAWDGSTGGVILIKANTLTLNDSVTVKGLGFRGALKENDNASQACYNNGVGGSTDYACATLSCGAPKGEGIGYVPGINYGRGKNANGGGGGNDHNTGGGGGSSYGAGGRGGVRSNVSNFSCPGPGPGEGGQMLNYTTTVNKVFMGGGGGAGDGNNNELTSGANGGGIIIIMAGTLNGNNRKINASGHAVDTLPPPNLARSDGAGGGGGGGTVLLFVDNFNGPVRVDVVGGTGGNLDNGGSPGPNAFCMGPGGGGGGGAIWVKGGSIPGNIAAADTGGANGKNVFGSGPPACPYLTTNGAQPGADGGTRTDLNIPVDTIPFVRLDVVAYQDTTICPGQTALLYEIDTATFPPAVLWSTGDTAEFILPQPTVTTTYTVTVTDWRGCTEQRNLVVTVLNDIPGLSFCCDTTVCPGGSVLFDISVNPPVPLTYQWNTGATDNAIIREVYNTEVFTVTVTDANGCTVSRSGTATVTNTPPALTVCCDTTVCVEKPVTMTANAPTAVSYVWNTGQSTATITLPVVSPTTFTVTITDAEGCKAIQSVQANVTGIQTTITAVPDTSILLGQTVQLTASGDSSSYTYTWSPANGLNNSSVYNPVAAPEQTTTYCVTVTSDIECTASACYTIELVQPDVKVPDAFTPNNSGVNDVFTIFPLKFAEVVQVKIFNRWGEVVYDVQGNGAWDGNYKGKAQPAGVYVVQVNYSSQLNPGKVFTVTKNITLIR